MKSVKLLLSLFCSLGNPSFSNSAVLIKIYGHLISENCSKGYV